MDGGTFPRILPAMLLPICQHLSLPQRKHLRWFLFGMLMSLRPAKLSHISASAPRGGHRTSCGIFLRSQWDGVSLMQMRAIEILRWMRIASVDGQLGRHGNVRMVLSKRPGDPWKKTLAVVTNETNLAAREIMVIYEKRWHIEIMFKELRSSLGLCDYQVQSRNAIERHLHLCGMAHQLLTHHSLMAQGAKAKEKNKEVSLPPLRERLDSLRSDIRSQQAKFMLAKIKNRNARSRIRAFLKNELQIAA